MATTQVSAANTSTPYSNVPIQAIPPCDKVKVKIDVVQNKLFPLYESKWTTDSLKTQLQSLALFKAGKAPAINRETHAISCDKSYAISRWWRQAFTPNALWSSLAELFERRRECLSAQKPTTIAELKKLESFYELEIYFKVGFKNINAISQYYDQKSRVKKYRIYQELQNVLYQTADIRREYTASNLQINWTLSSLRTLLMKLQQWENGKEAVFDEATSIFVEKTDAFMIERSNAALPINCLKDLGSGSKDDYLTYIWRDKYFSLKVVSSLVKTLQKLRAASSYLRQMHSDTWSGLDGSVKACEHNYDQIEDLKSGLVNLIDSQVEVYKGKNQLLKKAWSNLKSALGTYTPIQNVDDLLKTVEGIKKKYEIQNSETIQSSLKSKRIGKKNEEKEIIEVVKRDPEKDKSLYAGIRSSAKDLKRRHSLQFIKQSTTESNSNQKPTKLERQNSRKEVWSEFDKKVESVITQKKQLFRTQSETGLLAKIRDKVVEICTLKTGNQEFIFVGEAKNAPKKIVMDEDEDDASYAEWGMEKEEKPEPVKEAMERVTSIPELETMVDKKLNLFKKRRKSPRGEKV